MSKLIVLLSNAPIIAKEKCFASFEEKRSFGSSKKEHTGLSYKYIYMDPESSSG